MFCSIDDTVGNLYYTKAPFIGGIYGVIERMILIGVAFAGSHHCMNIIPLVKEK